MVLMLLAGARKFSFCMSQSTDKELFKEKEKEQEYIFSSTSHCIIIASMNNCECLRIWAGTIQSGDDHITILLTINAYLSTYVI